MGLFFCLMSVFLYPLDRVKVLEKIDHLPAWMREQIDHDLCFFIERGVSQQSLNATYARIYSSDHSSRYMSPSELAIHRYRFIEGALYRKGPGICLERCREFERALKKLHEIRPLPDLDFLLSFNDGVPETYVPPTFWITENASDQAPFFAQATLEGTPFIVLFPDSFTLERWEALSLRIKANDLPWESRSSLAFWRGTTNGGYSWENYLKKPRFILCWLSKQYPQLVDAGFSNIRCRSEILKEYLISIGVAKPVVSEEWHMKYKYLPVLDGFMCTYPGYLWRLLSGSVSFKQESKQVQYFYSALRAYEHYVPIANDMSDLLEKVEWARAHDAESKAITDRARDFCLAYCMIEDVYAYLYAVLAQYASLQRFCICEVKQEIEADSSWRLIFR